MEEGLLYSQSIHLEPDLHFHLVCRLTTAFMYINHHDAVLVQFLLCNNIYSPTHIAGQGMRMPLLSHVVGHAVPHLMYTRSPGHCVSTKRKNRHLPQLFTWLGYNLIKQLASLQHRTGMGTHHYYVHICVLAGILCT